MPLRVLVVESHRGLAARNIEALVDAGHDVSRCHDKHAPAFPCRGVTAPGSCPLTEGVDVALVVRRVGRNPTHRESGASCAIRAGVPLVVDGPSILDPYESFAAGRVTGTVVDACEQAARGAD